MKIKVRKIKHRNKKYFGEHNEKWAKGGGGNGYARMYGRNKYGDPIDHRSRAEKLNALDRKEIQNSA